MIPVRSTDRGRIGYDPWGRPDMIVLLAGVVIPVVLHFMSPRAMPWWPDTITLGIAFGITAALMAARFRQDRERNRRIGRALRDLFVRSR